MSEPLKKDFFRGTRFVPVGLVTVLVDGAIVGWLLLRWGREGAVLAGAAGWVAAYVLNFLGHKCFTFFNLEHKGWVPWRQFALHFALKFCNLGLRSAALYVFVVVLRWDWGLLLLALIPLWNFLANRWIFSGESPLQFCRMLRAELPVFARAVYARVLRRPVV